MTQKPRIKSPTHTVIAGKPGNGQPGGQLDVGQVLSDAEREFHIEDCAHQWRMAYERFQMHGNPNDRDEALQHLRRMNTAILGRSEAVQAQRHQAFEQRLSEGLDFFAVAGERDRGMLERRAA